MGFFDRLRKKKKEEIDPDLFETDKTLAEKGLPEEDLGLEEKSVFPEDEQAALSPAHLPRSTAAKPAISPRDIELLNSKLDTLKAILSSMDQRIANLEKAAGVEQKRMPW